MEVALKMVLDQDQAGSSPTVAVIHGAALSWQKRNLLPVEEVHR
jgi:hypothetical protein